MIRITEPGKLSYHGILKLDYITFHGYNDIELYFKHQTYIASFSVLETYNTMLFMNTLPRIYSASI